MATGDRADDARVYERTGERAKGRGFGTREVVGSRSRPERFKGSKDPLIDVVEWVGPMRRKRYQVKRSGLAALMARKAGNKIRAKAYNGADLVGEAYPTRRRPGGPVRWTSYTSER